MKMLKFCVNFESSMDIEVYAPEGTTLDKIQEIASDIASSPTLHGWDFPEYEAFVMSGKEVDVPDEERTRKPPNRYGFSAVVDGALKAKDGETVVLSDKGDDFVTAEDATWWEVKSTRG